MLVEALDTPTVCGVVFRRQIGQSRQAIIGCGREPMRTGRHLTSTTVAIGILLAISAWTYSPWRHYCTQALYAIGVVVGALLGAAFLVSGAIAEIGLLVVLTWLAGRYLLRYFRFFVLYLQLRRRERRGERVNWYDIPMQRAVTCNACRREFRVVGAATYKTPLSDQREYELNCPFCEVANEVMWPLQAQSPSAEGADG